MKYHNGVTGPAICCLHCMFYRAWARDGDQCGEQWKNRDDRIIIKDPESKPQNCPRKTSS